MIHGEGFGSDGGGYDLLDGEAGEIGAVGVEAVGVLAGDEDGSGDVGAGLVGVEGDGLPPVGDGGGGGGAVVGGGDGEEEVLDEELLGWGPFAVPDEVDVDGGGEDGTHVVAKVDKVGRALEFLGGRESSGWELGVVVLGIYVQCLDWCCGVGKCRGGSKQGVGQKKKEKQEGKERHDRWSLFLTVGYRRGRRWVEVSEG